MGELNAKIGAVNTGYEQVIGRHGVARMNENGKLFVDFCAQNNLVIRAVCSNTGVSIKEHGDNSTI